MRSKGHGWCLVLGLLAASGCGDEGGDAGSGGAGASGTTGATGGGGAAGPDEPVAITHLSVGGQSNDACAAVSRPGGLVCWNGWEGVSSAAWVEEVTGTVTSLAVGLNHTCVVSDGSVLCWGDGSSGQLGPGGSSDTPRVVGGLPPGVDAISVGQYHTLALVDGEVWWWGGEGLDATSFPDAPGAQPVRYDGLPTGEVEAIAAGGHFSCALIDGAAYCWGSNGSGVLGQGHVDPVAGAVKVVDVGPVDEIGAEAGSACARSGGEVWCWGWGYGMSPSTPGPEPIELPAPAESLHPGTSGTCVLAAGELHCWGSVGSYFVAGTPEVLPYSEGATLLAFDQRAWCAVIDGDVTCTGSGWEPSPLEGFDIDPGGAGGGGGSTPVGDDPYGRCESAASCPVPGSRCPGSSQGCLPPCSVPSDCPVPAGGGFSASCVGDVCQITCSATASACPAGMVCLAATVCGYD